jgi:signal transduction histidine kinase/CheY-like chemotaxis protein
MTAILLSNYYYFVTVFTALYCFAFILLLANRFQYSQPARAFAAWLVFVFLWSTKESLIAALHPHLDEEALRRAAVLVSPLYLLTANLTFHMLISIYNALVADERRFTHIRTTHVLLASMVGILYVLSLIEPSLMYSSFMKGPYDYHYHAGPALLAFGSLLIAVVTVPSVLLIRVSRSEPQSEALIVGAGSLCAAVMITVTNIVPTAFGLDYLPRLGVLLISVLCAASFYAIKRHGRTFTFGRVLDELKKAKMIGESLRGLLVRALDEDTIFQNICDSAQEISDSLYVCVVLFGPDDASYEIRGVSRATDTLRDSVFGRLPLSKGTTYALADHGLLSRQVDDPRPMECSGIAEFFGNQFDANTSRELNRLARIRQIVSYPIVLNDAIKGAIVLFRSTRTESLDLYAVFATQCALALMTSTHIRELEEKRKLEEMLHHSQKMDAVGQLAGGMAHDFNNMLSGISGYATIIKRKYGATDPTLAGHVDTILSASDRAADLIGKLLAFARKGKYQMTSVDVHQAIEEVMALLDRTIDKRIRIVRKLEAVPGTVLGDPTQIENIFLNLAVNARDAMEQGGTLTFATATTTVGKADLRLAEYAIKPGDYVSVSISDTGTGMDGETLAHIFEPFFTTKEVGKGTGLGLASVYGIVKNHGGHIRAESTPGVGTTFHVLLPLLRGTEAHGESLAKPRTDVVRGKGHIVVIDDEEIVRNLCKEILPEYGYTVTGFECGRDGVAYYREHWQEVDAAIVDMIMPAMNGAECIDLLKKINPAIKVIVTTGYDFTEKTTVILSSGINGFLQKPFREATLLKTIADVLAGRSQGFDQSPP